ncbi:LOW QUALITY PROTEIN: general transcription factor II-I repeat domain-containing protein 2-like, partial [Ciona intestinalis]
MEAKRRKIDNERRVFNDSWTDKYFHTLHHGKPVRLICTDTVAVNKEFNLKRHYESKAPEIQCFKRAQSRIDKLDKLKRNLEQQSSIFKKSGEKAEKNTLASYAVSSSIAKHIPFTDGKFILECLLTVVDIVCPEKRSVISNISLSART